MTLLLAALPTPAEFAGPTPSAQEINGLLEMLIQLPTNLHSLVGTAVRLFGGSMGGAAAAPRQAGLVSSGAVETRAGAMAVPVQEPRADGEHAALAAPAAIEVKAEEATAHAALPPAAPEPTVAAPPPATKPVAASGSDDSDSDNDEPLARRKRAGGADLYLQRLQKKQNVRP